MMGVISRTDFIQRQLAFTSKTKKKHAGSYKTHDALTKKIVSFSKISRKWMSFIAFKFTRNSERGKKFVYKRFAKPGRKRESFYYYKKFNKHR